MFAAQDDGKVAKNQHVMIYDAIVFNVTVVNETAFISYINLKVFQWLLMMICCMAKASTHFLAVI